MNYAQVLEYLKSTNVEVLENSLVFNQPVPSKYRQLIKTNEAKLIQDLLQPEADRKVIPIQSAKSKKIELLDEVKKLEFQAGLEDIESEKYPLSEMQEWKDRLIDYLNTEEAHVDLEPEAPQTVEDSPRGQVYQCPNIFPKPEIRYSEKGFMIQYPRIQGLLYHFQHERTAKLYQLITKVKMVDRVQQPKKLYSFENKQKTWSQWNQAFSKSVKENCPHLDPFDPTQRQHWED